MEYTVLIQYDTVDNIYVASIPELRGCMAHGRTREEALKEIGVVQEMWLDEARNMGLPIPEPECFAHAG